MKKSHIHLATRVNTNYIPCVMLDVTDTRVNKGPNLHFFVIVSDVNNYKAGYSCKSQILQISVKALSVKLPSRISYNSSALTNTMLGSI